MRVVTIVLALLIMLVQSELWLGRGGVPRTLELQSRLERQRSDNLAAKARNDQLIAEVGDLKEGLEMVEENARYELGMIKPDEILVQVTARRP
ncbi:MAG: cell division protein FtsB [Ideonella sp.]